MSCHNHRIIAFIFSLIISGLLLVPPATAARTTFAFAPAIGTTCTEALAKTVTVAGSSEKSIITSTATSTLQVKRDGNRIRYTETMGTISQTRDGKPATDIMSSIMDGLQITTLVNDHGDVIGLEGDNKIRERINAQAPKASREELLQATSHEKFLTDETRDWQEHVGRFVGRSATTGSCWIDITDIPLVNGTIAPVYRITQVSGLVNINGHDTLKISTHCNTNLDALARVTGVSVRDLTANLSRKLPSQQGYMVTAASELFVDPATLTHYKETSTVQTILYLHAQDGSPKPIEIREQQQTSWTY